MATTVPLHLCICLQALISSPAIWVPCGLPLFSGIICIDRIDGTFHQAIRRKRKSNLFQNAKAAAGIN